MGGDLFTNRKEVGEDGLPIYSVTVNDGMVPRASFDRDFYDIADSASNRKACKGDIAYNMMRMWQGAQGVAPVDCMVSPAYVVLEPRKDASAEFFAYFFKLPQSLELLTATSRGLTKDRLRLYFDDFARMRLCAPEHDEQSRIAACLASVDELISAESQKLDALKAYKKGLMQQLFPREGETLPRLRFPEFRDAPEWAAQSVGPKTAKVGSGITPSGGDKNYKLEGRPFIRSQNVGWGVLLLDDVAYIDEVTHKSFDSTEIKSSDVLLNITGASIGRSALADARIVGGNVNQHVCIIRVIAEELSPTFVNQFLLSDIGQKQIDSFQAGGNRQGLNFAQIRAFSIPLPPTLAEQQRIASCLSSLDNLIAAQGRRIEALKVHKRGLMQQLFPSAAEAVE